MTNWNEVAEALRTQAMPTYDANRPLYDAAIALCELAARLPPGEAERVLKFQIRRQEIRASTDADKMPMPAFGIFIRGDDE